MKREAIARIAHEINRAYCASQGDLSHKAWTKTSKEQKASILAGVDMHLANPESTPQAQHEAWMAAKVADGWTIGETKDEAAKTHPALVAYEDLPPVQKAKDYIFKMVVAQLKDLADEAAGPVIVPGDRISVKYIGHGGNRQTHKDALYGTEIVWNFGRSVLVPAKIATIMLALHPEVYGPGDNTETAPVVDDKAKAEDEEFQRVQAVRDSIANMSKADVTLFVKTNFRQDVADGKVADMRAAAVRLVEQYGVA